MSAHNHNDSLAPMPQDDATVALDGAGQIVAFVVSPESEAAIRGGLASLPDDLQVRRGTIRHAVRHFEKAPRARAIIVDISGIDDPLSALDELARVCPPDLKVFVIGENTNIGFYRTLIQDVGVVEYIVKPLTRDNVQRLIAMRLTGGAVGSPDGRSGHVVVVCGARGGVGATTLAANVALDIAGSIKGHVALLDFHLQGGTAAMMFGGSPGPGLRIAMEDAERADTLFLERTAIVVDPRLRLIAAEEPFDASPHVTDAGAERVLGLLRQKFNFVIVDMPMPPPPAMRAAIGRAREVIIALQPDVASLRNTLAIRAALKATVSADRVITVLNRADGAGALPMAMVQKGLGEPPAVVIPDLGRRMVEAVNLGVPALRHVPALRQHLAPLTREIAGIPTPETRSWLTSLLRK